MSVRDSLELFLRGKKNRKFHFVRRKMYLVKRSEKWSQEIVTRKINYFYKNGNQKLATNF